MSIAPTGKRMEMTGISITRIEGDEIEEIWENYDTLGLMQQLGSIPAAGQSGKLALPRCLAPLGLARTSHAATSVAERTPFETV